MGTSQQWMQAEAGMADEEENLENTEIQLNPLYLVLNKITCLVTQMIRPGATA